jgi:AraC-like DNA-binding protein
MSKDLLIRHRRLVTTDLDEARDHASRLWERHDSHLRRGRAYALRWHQADLAHTKLTYIHNFSPLHVNCGPISNAFHLTMHEAGHLRHRINGRMPTSTPSSAVLHAPGQELQLETEPFRILLLTFDGEFVRRALAKRLNMTSPVETLATDYPLGSPPVASLQSLTRWVACELDRPGTPLLQSQRAVASLERTLLALLLDCLEARHRTAQRTADVAASHLRQLEGWLDCNFAEPVGIEEMAQVAGVSVRAVQSAFRRFRGCTPTEALVSRRLHHAHSMLSGAPPGTTVTQVALDCGFFHLGRFSGRYARAFGESPSETLAHSRRQHG